MSETVHILIAVLNDAAVSVFGGVYSFQVEDGQFILQLFL